MEPWHSTRPSCSRQPRTTSGCTSPGTAPTTDTTCRSSCAARAPTSTTPTASATSTRWPACSSASSATAAPTSPRPRPSRPSSWRSCRCGPTPTPTRSSWPQRVADYAPGDLNRVFFTSGGGEAVETAWKLAKNYFKLTGKPMKHKVLSPHHRLPRHHPGRAVDHRAARAQAAVRAAGALDVPRARTPTSTARPSTSPTTSRAFGRWAADQIAVQIENEGPDTVAAVFLEPVQNAGGCFPPPPGYFQRVREICDEYDVLLVSDEVICAFGRLGPHVRRRALRLRAGHDHLRQGHHLRLRPARRDDRQRQADGAVPGGRRDVRARLHLRRPPGLDRGRAGQPRHLREREDPRERPLQRGRLPRRPSSGSRTCRSSATSAATGSSTGSSWSRTRRPRRPSPTRSASGCSTASSPSSCTPRASTAAPTTAATRSSSSRRR